ncbi:lysophospholipid acyltransferase family protein [Parabacteroides sp. OttesenSCG-928-G06]|nr:lysophospholipid acyltransferase family protein [Parabacteroides sp. OttesenSCG-928-K15]MDL2281518.1 lysophospholipid acyltransferase family protein [Parabacteroides sp. OttesenSCG-928-G06]
MKKWLSRTILRLTGWKIGSTEGVELPKCVICVAPHTSNWDFPIGKIVYSAIGVTASFLIKKDWFFFPFNLLFKSIGGVPIDRDRRTSVTEQMVAEFNSRDRFQLAITPEGTRKPVEEWKKGFYFIALEAKVPILLAYIDYGKKEAGMKAVFYPTGNVTEDIYTIRSYYRDVKGRKPENFISV